MKHPRDFKSPEVYYAATMQEIDDEMTEELRRAGINETRAHIIISSITHTLSSRAEIQAEHKKYNHGRNEYARGFGDGLNGRQRIKNLPDSRKEKQ